jgi:hypothetical protein
LTPVFALVLHDSYDVEVGPYSREEFEALYT